VVELLSSSLDPDDVSVSPAVSLLVSSLRGQMRSRASIGPRHTVQPTKIMRGWLLPPSVHSGARTITRVDDSASPPTGMLRSRSHHGRRGFRMADIEPRKGLPSVHLTEDQFRARVRERFVDPAFRTIDPEIDLVTRIARDAYEEGRKSPNTRKAGAGYHDPDYELSVEWIEASARIAAAAAKWRDETLPTRILLISGSPRSDQTCPGEMSKSWRMLELAKTTIAAAGNVEIDELDLGRITAEYGRSIHPCKGCVSTAMPLCHWPCSCYPNHSLGQVHDWMNEIYERWTAAHGVMIVTPVHWYQAPSVLKLMIDRLVCADGGNADPTLTGGKDPKQAKKVELDGWDYPKHLAGRAFSVVVHGDAEGVRALTSALFDWLTTLGLVAAGPQAVVGRYIGYMQPYATSHADLDRDEALLLEVRNAATTLLGAERSVRHGEPPRHDATLPDPRPK